VARVLRYVVSRRQQGFEGSCRRETTTKIFYEAVRIACGDGLISLGWISGIPDGNKDHAVVRPSLLEKTMAGP
jgi:hypothetical protein